jgi:beta-lactamase regulating signal transducer with metallopeptidase domain
MAETWNSAIEWINRAGAWHWGFASAMFVQATVLVGVLGLLETCVRRHVAPGVRYWLWSLVLLTLMLPVSLRPLAGIASWTVAEPVAVSREAHPAVERQSTEPLESQPDVIPSPVRRNSLDAFGWVLVVWSAIAAVLGGIIVRRARKVHGLVRRAADAPVEWHSALEVACELLEVRQQRVRLLMSDEVGCPAVFGFRRLTILIPSPLIDWIDDEQCQFVLVHELSHWRRGDLQMNLLQTLLQIVYFYNPAVWITNVVLRRLREQAVDDAVLVALALPAEEYIDTLLNVATVSLRPLDVSLRLVGILESRKALLQRIRRMIDSPEPDRDDSNLFRSIPEPIPRC